MPLLKKGVLMPVTGIDFSMPATFIGDQNTFPQNVYFWRSEMRKRPGKSAVGSVISDATQIMGLGKLEMSSGIKYAVRASKAAMEKFNTSTSAWESIIATAFTGGDEDFFQFDTVSEWDLLIATNGYDKIRKWGGSGNAALLGGNPPLAKDVCYMSPYLLLGYTDDGGIVKPWEVAWCDTDNPEEWSTGNAGSALLSIEPSPLRKLMRLNQYVVAYKQRSLWLGRKVETSDIIIFDPIQTGIGLASPRAVVEAEGMHYFMGLNDFYVFNGARAQPIGQSVRDEVFSKLDRSKISRCFAVHVQELTEVWFFIVVSGGTWPAEVWRFNYRNGFWYYDTLATAMTAGMTWERWDTESWDDDTGTWDEAQDTWDSGSSMSEWEQVLLGASDGTTNKVDYTTTDDMGNAVEAVVVTKDFIGEQLETNKRWEQLDVWARGTGKMYVDYSIDHGDNWTNIPFNSSRAYLDLDGSMRKYELYFDIKAQHIRFRFRNNVTGETFFLRNFMPYYLNEEEVRA